MMKHIKEKFEFDEEEIKLAIKYWINSREAKQRYDQFNISFTVERVNKPAPPGAPTGGQADYSVQVVSAVAEKL